MLLFVDNNKDISIKHFIGSGSFWPITILVHAFIPANKKLVHDHFGG